ncbi:MAG TPA: DUF3352 domain-containing protein [Gaiellaceae bacterium]|nr:DUF3352 domain-containing protein [Gaiellaceae bacterium]
MRGRLAGIAAVALLAAGCGGGGGGGTASSDNAAGIVPADAIAFVTVDTDFGSDQIKNAESVLNKFPIKQKLLAELRSSMSSQGVDANALTSSVGPELDLAVLSVNGKTNLVGFTKPKNEQAFDAQLDKGSSREVHTKIDGWTAFADTQAYLDAVKNRKANLSDDASYTAAAKTLPSSALATAYASPSGIQTAAAGSGAGSSTAASSALEALGSAKWFAGALTSSNGAFSFELHTKSSSTTSSGAASGPGLVDEIPSGSIVALSIVGGSGVVPANLKSQVSGLSSTLGIDLGGLLGAFDGPVIAYVRAGLPLPEVTIAAKPSNPARTTTAVGQLIAKLTQHQFKPVKAQVDGGTLEKLDLGVASIYYGDVNGQVVVTDSANALSELKGSAGKLTGDQVFKDAKSASGMPDTSQGFLFIDLKDALPAISGIAQLANQQIPPGVQKNLAPLRSLLVYGSQTSGVENGVFYLDTN